MLPSPSTEGFASDVSRQLLAVSSFKVTESLFLKRPVILGSPCPLKDDTEI